MREEFFFTVAMYASSSAMLVIIEPILSDFDRMNEGFKFKKN